MSFVDLKYIHLVSPRLNKFSKKKDYLYNFRCPYCGDSTKNKNRARGFFYRMKADMVFKCHNCGVGRTLANFLKDIDTNLYDQYVMERFKSGTTGRGSTVPEPKFDFEKPVFKKTILSDLEKVSDLNNLHPAKEYLLKRKIPENFLSKLYFAEDFNAWSKSENTNKESRIVIPLLTPSGELFGYQGRSLDKNSKLRYITTILDKEYPKLFGLDRIDATKTIYVTEGPFDSLFLSNGLAMCGADVVLDRVLYPDRVFIYDNEPRNPQIIARIDKTIRQGDKVVIWPSTIKEKDINDMVISGHSPQEIIETNTYQGIEAKLKFNNWKKI